MAKRLLLMLFEQGQARAPFLLLTGLRWWRNRFTFSTNAIHAQKRLIVVEIGDSNDVRLLLMD